MPIEGDQQFKGTVIFGSYNGVTNGFPALPEHSPIVGLFQDTLRLLGFSDTEIKSLLEVRMRRSEIVQKILVLNQLWCWSEINMTGVISNCRRLLGRKPETIIDNMKQLEELMGQEQFANLVGRDPDLLNRRPQTLRDASIQTRDFLKEELNVDLQPFKGCLGLAVYRTPPEATR